MVERSIPRRAGDATASRDENNPGDRAGAWRPRGRRRSIESDGIGRVSKRIAVRLAEDGTAIDFPEALAPNEGHP